jgi:hypothetical protein
VRRHAGQREKREFEAEGISDEDESWRDWGPVSEAKAAFEFCRIESVTHSLMQHGFVPKANLGEQIWVRLLTSGRRSVAWVYSGHHRTAALAALGYETAPVYVMRQVFRRDEVSSWPGVASGAFTPEAALAIFDMAFEGRSDPWPGCVLPGTGSVPVVCQGERVWPCVLDAGTSRASKSGHAERGRPRSELRRAASSR